MATREELDKLDRLMARQERRVRDAILAYVAGAKGELDLDTLTELIETGRISEAIAIVNGHISGVGNSVITAFGIVGVAESGLLSRKIPPKVAISFDPGDPHSARVADNIAMSLIREVSESQVKSIRQAVVRGQQEGLNPRAVATLFRDSIGLTAAQEQAVLNYRKLLESGSGQALERGLRDRRFDRTVGRSIRDDVPLTSAQINNMVSRYRDKYIKFRAETIGRTEGVRTTSIARQEALRQFVEQAEIPQDNIIRVWNPTRDARTRDWHSTMADQKRGLNEPFVDGNGTQIMFPGDPNAPAETTINCRCILTTEIKTS